MALEYMIIQKSYIEDLVEKVQSRIDEGWIPQGGVGISKTHHGTSYTFTQAMIKK
jgi:hypothetical protein